MELRAGPGGGGWELWAGPGSSEQADNRAKLVSL